MTRALQITNTSNWEGEDYEVVIFDQSSGAPGERGWRQRTLAPGDIADVASYSEHAVMVFHPTGPSLRSFRDDEGFMIAPKVSIQWERI